MIIRVDDFERALKVMQAAELKMHKTFGGLGRSQYSEVVELVLEYVSHVKRVSRSDLLKKFYRDIDPQSLKIVEEVLTNMKVMRITYAIDGEIYYDYIEQLVKI